MLCFRKFTETQLRQMAGIRQAYRSMKLDAESGHYDTHHPWSGTAPGLSANISFGVKRDQGLSYRLEIRSARFAYAMVVLEKAWQATRERFPDYADHVWEGDSEGHPVLRFVSPHRAVAGKYFADRVSELVNNESIVVTESCVVAPSTDSHMRSQKTFTAEVVLDRAAIDREVEREIMDIFERDEPVPVSRNPLRFPLETVNEYIVCLEHSMVELLNGKDSILPIREIDQRLIDAANRLDMPTVRDLLQAGANVNCIDRHGDTPLSLVIENGETDSLKVDEHERFFEQEYPKDPEGYETEWESRCLERVRELLEWGADPNLFGYDGVGPLREAVYKSFPKVVALLLERGANPNYNPFAEEEPEIVSAPLDGAVMHALFSVARDETERRRNEKIVLLLTRAGARRDKDDDGLIYPEKSPYELTDRDRAFGQRASEARRFYLACQIAAGINTSEVGVFSPFFADDIVYENESTGVRKDSVLTVIRHFEEVMDAIKADFMAFRLIAEPAIDRATGEPFVVLHGLTPTCLTGLGVPQNTVRFEVDAAGNIQRIIASNASPPLETMILDGRYPGFSPVELRDLLRNRTAGIPPNQDVQVNVYRCHGIRMQEVESAARMLKEEFPCIVIQEISSEDHEKTRFYGVRATPSLDILYRGRLMLRFDQLPTCKQIVERVRRRFEPGFRSYRGVEGQGNRWGAFGDTEQVVARLLPIGLAQGEIECQDPVRRVWEDHAAPRDELITSIIHGSGPLQMRIVLWTTAGSERSSRLVTAFPMARRGTTLPVTIREIQPWGALAEGVIVGNLDGGDTPEEFGAGAQIGFFDTQFYLNSWRYRAGERLMFELAGLVVAVEKVEELTFATTDQNALKRLHEALGETPELDQDGRIKPMVHSMDGMRALMCGGGEYPEDCSFHMKISKINSFDFEGIPVLEVFGPLWPTGPIEDGVVYIPQPVLPSGTVLRVGDNIRGTVWMHGCLAGERR